MPINVFLIEDHDIVRQGIKLLIEADPDITVIGESGDLTSALKKLGTMTPDVMMINLNTSFSNYNGFIAALKNQYPNLKILLLSTEKERKDLIELLSLGAHGYVLKNTSKTELLYAIKILNDGQKYISPEFTEYVLSTHPFSSKLDKSADRKVDLSAREQEVLNLIAQGLTNTQMANKLFISVRTIESRRKNILQKTNTTNTATLIRFATLNGLIS